MNIQQQEALRYFSTHAEDWRSKAEGAGVSEVNVIQHRNDYVLRIAAERTVTRSLLDVGCGTGELVCEAAGRGIDAVGVDYAEEMIALASDTSRAVAVGRARFVWSSIFDFDMGRERYDLISANGFIEYITQDEMCLFFDRVARALTPGGSFVVGSRNRLFNLISMNTFTSQELESGTVETLLKEAIAWNETTVTMPQVTAARCAPLQVAESRHASTGIDVATRYQYSPFQLIHLLQVHGLRPRDVTPIHIHGVPPAFGQLHPQMHTAVANLLHATEGAKTTLLVHASSFMLHVQKEG